MREDQDTFRAVSVIYRFKECSSREINVYEKENVCKDEVLKQDSSRAR